MTSGDLVAAKARGERWKESARLADQYWQGLPGYERRLLEQSALEAVEEGRWVASQRPR